MSEKHTPFKTPFRCLEHDGAWPSKDLPWIVRDADGKHVATIIAPPAGERERVAQWLTNTLNAAPEMLAALRACHSAMDRLMGDTDWPDPDAYEVKAAQAAMAAISRATSA